MWCGILCTFGWPCRADGRTHRKRLADKEAATRVAGAGEERRAATAAECGVAVAMEEAQPVAVKATVARAAAVAEAEARVAAARGRNESGRQQRR